MKLRRRTFQFAVATTQAASIVLAAVLASWLRFGGAAPAFWSTLSPRPALALFFYAAFSVVLLNLFGLYRFDDVWSTRLEVSRIARAVFGLALVTMSLLFILGSDDVSRALLVLFFVIAWGLITLTTLATRAFFASRRRRGRGVSRLLLVNAGGDISDFALSLSKDHPELGLQVVGFVGDEEDCPSGVTWYGTLDSLPDVLEKQVVDEVLTAPDAQDWSVVDEVVAVAQEQGKTVRMPLPALGRDIARGSVDSVSGVPVLSVAMTPDHALALASKRLLDIVGSLVGLIVLSPFFVFAIIGTLIADGRPVLFRQLRTGLHGRPIRVIKFRTMQRDAESFREAMADQSERDGPAFKIADDPRITGFGQFLRKTSMDELPQLVNVLLGELSLVGPRPLPLIETAELTFADRRRLSMRPGITCLWQIEARGDPSWETWINLDLQYIDNWSLGYDLQILARTPWALVRSPGS